jgi:hypothetical protein
MPFMIHVYLHIRMRVVYAAFGFFVPYFDLDVILLPTPPYNLLVIASHY